MIETYRMTPIVWIAFVALHKHVFLCRGTNATKLNNIIQSGSALHIYVIILMQNLTLDN